MMSNRSVNQRFLTVFAVTIVVWLLMSLIHLLMFGVATEFFQLSGAIIYSLTLIGVLSWILVKTHFSIQRMKKWRSAEQRALRRKCAQARQAANAQAQLTKSSFDHRLHRFLDANIHIPDQGSDNFARPTPYWQRQPFHKKTPAKPIAWIRSILYRIRQTIHG